MNTPQTTALQQLHSANAHALVQARFSIERLRAACDWPSIHAPSMLIEACTIVHVGAGREFNPSKAAWGLARWILQHEDDLERPRSGAHPLNAGTVIERLLAGVMVPESGLAAAIEEMSGGTVSYLDWEMPLHPEVAAAEIHDTAADIAPTTDDSGRMAIGVDVSQMPPLSPLGGQLPSGRLFHIIGDPRLPSGFVLAGCGMMVCLDEAVALAMRDTLEAGLLHLRDVRSGDRRAAA